MTTQQLRANRRWAVVAGLVLLLLLLLLFLRTSRLPGDPRAMAPPELASTRHVVPPGLAWPEPIPVPAVVQATEPAAAAPPSSDPAPAQEAPSSPGTPGSTEPVPWSYGAQVLIAGTIEECW